MFDEYCCFVAMYALFRQMIVAHKWGYHIIQGIIIK